MIRHSHARRCTIRLTREDGDAEAVRAEVRDDGRGFGADRNGAGLSGGSGLAGLAERVAEVDGAEFEAGPLPDGGFRLRVSLPLRDRVAVRGKDGR